jgi:hypothetical protein
VAEVRTGWISGAAAAIRSSGPVVIGLVLDKDRAGNDRVQDKGRAVIGPKQGSALRADDPVLDNGLRSGPVRGNGLRSGPARGSGLRAAAAAVTPSGIFSPAG